jgi:hypothetical protein
MRRIWKSSVPAREALSGYECAACCDHLRTGSIPGTLSAREPEWLGLDDEPVVEEVGRNLADFPLSVSGQWIRLRSDLLLMDDVLTLNRPVVFSAGKDRPVLFSALAWADVLLTLDSGNFGELLAGSFYRMPVLLETDKLWQKCAPSCSAARQLSNKSIRNDVLSAQRARAAPAGHSSNRALANFC